MEELFIIIFWGYVILRIVGSLLKKGKEAAKKFGEQQKAKGEVPEAIKKLYEYEEQRQKRPRKKLTPQESYQPTALSYDMLEQPLTAYVPIEITEEEDLEVEHLDEQALDTEDGESAASAWMAELDLRKDLHKGVILKEILDRKF